MGSGPVVLLDIDGVLTVSWRPIAGAAEAVAKLRHQGWPIAFVTNTTSSPRRGIAERLAEAGIAARQEEIFTAPRAAAGFLRRRHPGARCLLLNSGSVEEDLGGVHLVTREAERADVVLTGGAGAEVGYLELDRAFRFLLDGAALVAMHKNLQWETSEGPRLDIGAFVIGLERASGVDATVVGKPAPAFFHSILRELDAAAERSVMVGDDVEADVLGAGRSGIRGVLVRTGKFRPDALGQLGRSTVEVVDSISDLPDLLGPRGA